MAPVSRRPPWEAGRVRRWFGPLAAGLVVMLGTSVGLSAANSVPDARVDHVGVSVLANDLAPLECLNHHGAVLTNVVVVKGGTAGNDLVLGTAAGESLHGGGGTDCIVGGAGNDTLDGGDGSNDYVWGQSGNDSVAGGGGSNDHCNGGSGSSDSTPLLLHGCESTSGIP